MLILGIESSCDETAVALVEDGCQVRASVVASQFAAHLPFGGVVPEVAAREHLRVIDPLFHQALAEANVTADAIDAVAVTQGPGLIGALLVGVSYAKGLALGLGKPLVPVDHVQAHVHGALLGVPPVVEFYPALSLVVSGGHTNLYRMRGPNHFHLLACSVDDACGESFDKVAKILGLGYPGGPVIEKLAAQGDPARIAMPRMVSQKARMEFSYSGLKTHMSNLVQQEKARASAKEHATGALDAVYVADICAAFQEEALGQIVRKLATALAAYPDTKHILVAGGVAANQRFRRLMAEQVARPALFPAQAYCSDNAAMIAAYGFHVWQEQQNQAAAAQADAAAMPGLHVWDAYSRYQFARAKHAT